MNKGLKFFLITLSILCVSVFGLFLYGVIITSDVKFNENLLINMERKITFFDENDNEVFTESSGRNVVPLSELPNYVKNSFISVEDKRFYSHNGIDYKGQLRAIKNNLFSFSFKEGASTISQQLIKNTHLSNKKTLKRKLSEIKLAKILEKKYDKDQILEKYLNTIYFGGHCYGISQASDYYFGKKCCDLSINESAGLAGMIKAPSTYSPFLNEDKFNKRKNIVLLKMKEQNYISESEFNKYIKEEIKVSKKDSGNSNKFDYFHVAQNEINEINEINEKSPYSTRIFKVYTNYCPVIQKNITESFENQKLSHNYSGIVIDNKGKIKGYYSNIGNICRQTGSVIKPLLVYAPAIENDIVSPDTWMVDEKINFNGYCPKNYRDKYYGNVTVKESLGKSLNCCAVKLLNATGIDNSKLFLKRMDINLSESDNSLALALGATENGINLLSMTGAYSVFNNNGKFVKPYTIRKILSENDEILYSHKSKEMKVFTDETITLMNDMLRYTVTDGTARKLSYLDFPVYGKTGTVGSLNGNTDAYSISYNKDYITSTWIGNKDKILMNNKITGGTIPSIIAGEIWKSIYNGNIKPDDIPSTGNIKDIKIDKNSYFNEHKIVLSDPVAPEKTCIKILEKTKNIYKIPIDNSYSHPVCRKPIITVNNNGINIQLCQTEYIYYKILKFENNSYNDVYDSYYNKNTFTDSMVKDGGVYCYKIIPYYLKDDKKFYGTEFITDKIKFNAINSDDDWWQSDE